jgi:hypothetical protein
MRVLMVGILSVAFAQPLWACDLCAVYAATEARGDTGKGFFAGLAEQYTYFNTFQSGGENAPNPDGERMRSLISQAFIGYNSNNRIGVQFNLPVIYKQWSKIGEQDSEAGIGDALLLGNFHLYARHTMDFTFNWNALAGIKFPTGNSDRLNPAEPDFAAGIGGHDLTLGSGSFDGAIGTDIFVRWKSVFATVGIQYAIRSEGSFDYQFANDVCWAAGPGFYLLLEDNYALSLEALFSGETKGEDTIEGVPTDDTAETLYYLGPQINFTWGNDVSMLIGADLPLSITGTGEQIVPTYRVHAAFTWRF